MSKTRVLIVDDSALVRHVLKTGLGSDPGIEVVGTAQDPYVARDLIVELKPDVLTLDVEMPRMDGVDFLRKLMPQFPIPVVMVSALTQRGKRITLEALEAGAIDFVTKPSSGVQHGLETLIQELTAKVKIASTANVGHWKNKRITTQRQTQKQALAESTDKVIAVGSSTGGTEAIRTLLFDLPPHTPGMVVVQHMPAGFTRMFANRLNEQVPMIVKEAEDGDRIITGRALIAPGGRQLRVVRKGGIYEVVLGESDPIGGHCPSVDAMMKTVATACGSNAMAVMLTGMGRDGAAAMLEMRRAGARTFAQDEKTCVVFGMPKEAYTIGAAEQLVPLPDMAETIRQAWQF